MESDLHHSTKNPVLNFILRAQGLSQQTKELLGVECFLSLQDTVPVRYAFEILYKG